MDGISIATIILGLGGSGTIGAVVTAVVVGLFARGGERAKAASTIAEAEKTGADAELVRAESAKIIADTAAAVTQRFEVENTKLINEMRGLKDAVEGLSNKVDEVIPLLEQSGHSEVAAGLRDANRLARRAI